LQQYCELLYKILSPILGLWYYGCDIMNRPGVKILRLQNIDLPSPIHFMGGDSAKRLWYTDPCRLTWLEGEGSKYYGREISSPHKHFYFGNSEYVCETLTPCWFPWLRGGVSKLYDFKVSNLPYISRVWRVSLISHYNFDENFQNICNIF
jgi:hypothetical protein